MNKLPKPEKPATVYSCDGCGKLMSESEGGKIFTVCEICWDKHYKPKPAEPAITKSEVANIYNESTSEVDRETRKLNLAVEKACERIRKELGK